MDPLAWVSFVASLAQLVDYASRATRAAVADDPAAAAWRGVVEAAARHAVHSHAADRAPDDQAALFDRLLDLVAAKDITAWTILGNPHLTRGDLVHLGPDVAALAADFARELHERLATEAARAGSPLTSTAVISTLGHLSVGVASISERIDAVRSDVLEMVQDRPANVDALPPATQAALERAKSTDPEGARRLARHLTSGTTPDQVLRPLSSDDAPAWWRGVAGATTVAAATFAAAHLQAAAASRLYEQASDLEGVDRARALAFAAFYAHDLDEERANGLLGRAQQQTDDDLLVATMTSLFATDPDGVLSTAGTALHLDDVDGGFIAGIQRWALKLNHRLSDAVTLARDFLEEHPENAGMHLQLARMLRERAETERSTREADLEAAMSAALECRRLRRQWHGDSGEAAHEACLIAAVDEDWDAVMRIGRSAPDGEALTSEAVNNGVIGQVAAAAVLSHQPEIARPLLPKVTAEYTRHLLQGWIAELDHDDETAIAELTAAANSASDDSELAWALRGLAGLKVWPLPGFLAFAERNADYAEIVTAISEISRGLFDDAIVRLTPLRRSSPHVPAMLAEAHDRSGRPDHAVEELRAGFDASGDGSLLVLACRILVRAARFDDAEAIAAESMSLIAAGRTARHQLRQLLMELSARRGAYRRVEDLASAALAEGDPDPGVRWHLAHALHRRNANDAAWDVLQASPPLMPRTEAEAELWLHVHARTSPERATISQMLEVIALFPDSEDVQAAALVLFYTRRGERNVEEAEGQAIQALAADFVERWPESQFMWSKSMSPDDPALFAKQVEEIARTSAGRRKRVVAATEQYAVGRLPFGMVAHVAGATMTEALLSRVGFQIVNRTDDQAEIEADVEAAASALGEVVLIDLNAAHVASMNGRWPTVLAAFRRVITIDAVLADVQAAIANLSLERGGHLGFDDINGRAVVTGPDPELDALHRDQASAMLAGLQQVDAASCTRLPLFPEFDDGKAIAWLGPLQIASERGAALFSDDVGLRRLAKAFDVPAFGTLDLIDALAAAGRITIDDRREWRQALCEAHVVDVHTDAAVLLASGAPLTTISEALSRRWPWVEPGAVRELLGAADDSGDRDAIQVASYWFAVGAARFDPATAAARCTGRIIELSGNISKPGAAGAIELMRRACIDRDIEDPLPDAVRHVRAELEQRIGTRDAPQFTMQLFAQLDDAAQRVVLRVLTLG